MGAAAAVEELEVDEERLSAPAEAHREALGHAIEEERTVALLRLRPPHHLAGTGRYEDLGFETGGGHLGGLRHLGGKHTILDEEHIGVEASALVAGAYLADQPVDPHHVTAGQGSLQSHHVIQLEKAVVGHSHPELEGSGVLGADHPAHGGVFFVLHGSLRPAEGSASVGSLCRWRSGGGEVPAGFCPLAGTARFPAGWSAYPAAMSATPAPASASPTPCRRWIRSVSTSRASSTVMAG